MSRRTSDGYPWPGVYPLRALRAGEFWAAALRLTGRSLGRLFPLIFPVVLVGSAVSLGLLDLVGWVRAGGVGVPLRPTQSAGMWAWWSRVFGLSCVQVGIGFLPVMIGAGVIAPRILASAITDPADPQSDEILDGRRGFLVLTSVLASLLLIACAAVLVIPYLIILPIVAVLAPTVVVERNSFRAGFKRAVQLTRYNKVRVLMTLLAVALVNGLVVQATNVALDHLGLAYTVSGYLARQAIHLVPTTLVDCIMCTVVALLYVNLRMRKEQLAAAFWDMAIEIANEGGRTAAS